MAALRNKLIDPYQGIPYGQGWPLDYLVVYILLEHMSRLPSADGGVRCIALAGEIKWCIIMVECQHALGYRQPLELPERRFQQFAPSKI